MHLPLVVAPQTAPLGVLSAGPPGMVFIYMFVLLHDSSDDTDLRLSPAQLSIGGRGISSFCRRDSEPQAPTTIRGCLPTPLCGWQASWLIIGELDWRTIHIGGFPFPWLALPAPLRALFVLNITIVITISSSSTTIIIIVVGIVSPKPPFAAIIEAPAREAKLMFNALVRHTLATP